MKKIIIIVLAVAVVFAVLFWKFGPDFSKKPQTANAPVTLTVWGLWEDENALRPAIEAYKKLRPNVTVKYVHQSSLNYRTRVQIQVTNGQGPDIFMIHNSWLQMFLKAQALSELPVPTMAIAQYEQIFFPVAKKSLTSNNKVYAIPRGIDGLALYYNEDILKAVGVGVPVTWDDFVIAAKKLTVIDSNGKIQTAGAALGSTGNVDHWSDILGLLFLQQPGASLEKPNTAKGAEVLQFYTEFITDPRKRVWDTNMESSTQAFAAGRLAFYFAPSWRAQEIRAANQSLNFKTAPVPQLTSRKVGYANFWAYAVSSKSVATAQSWEFLKFLTLPETERLLYQEAAKTRLFGLPYSRLDLQSQLADDPLVGAFVNQGQFYDWWYLSSGTRDQGINDQIIKYYEDAVNATLQGGDPLSALQTTSQGVKQVLDDFKITTAPITQ